MGTPSRVGQKRSFSNSYSSPNSTPKRDTKSFSFVKSYTHDVRLDKKRRKVTFEDEMITKEHKIPDENSLANMIRESRSERPLSRISNNMDTSSRCSSLSESDASKMIQQQFKEMERLLMGKISKLENQINDQAQRLLVLEEENYILKKHMS